MLCCNKFFRLQDNLNFFPTDMHLREKIKNARLLFNFTSTPGLPCHATAEVAIFFFNSIMLHV